MNEFENNYEVPNDEESVQEEKVVMRNLDVDTDIEIKEVNSRYNPGLYNGGSSLRTVQPLIKKRKQFNKYGSFSQINRNGGFVRMAGIGGIIAVAAFIVLYLLLKQ